MRDQQPQPRREAFGFPPPVLEERRRRDQQVRTVLTVLGFTVLGLTVLGLTVLGLAVPSREAEHGERLNGLPEPHVVGEAAAEPEAPQGEQPAHPALLVGAEDRPQSGVCGRFGRRRGVPERPELLPEPGTGDHVRPVGGLRIFDLAGRFREVDPGEEPHRLPQRDPERLGVRLRLLPGAEHLPEFLRVHLDPFPAG